MTKLVRGPVERVANAYDSIVTKSLGVGVGTGVAIFQQQLQVLEVTIQNDPGSASNIAVGNQYEQYFVLIPGASLRIPINDVNNVYVRGITGNATVHWIAMV